MRLRKIHNPVSVHSDALEYRFSFPQIQGIQVKQLVRVLLTSDDSTSEDVMNRLQAKLASLSGVRLERSADAMGMFWNGLSKGKVVAVEKEPSTIPPVRLLRPQVI